ncbi:glucose-6-phosphate dehydrogenase [Mesorhizobium sp. BAC0120]|uniref:glucose-6-phosphate dehydrogenase n=1 Tax=Mesorhizobium sp. BAC0120 TaxID=3090670 RepID=UPI00298D43BA|nr:glucose-6-phosphate dehydrogenase [Mesorhizobium sp. BAC0120]MDW6025107.1 glucose-6-phosphate dehydrogenase [Mesorhizobium sp. BAC0120]
MTSQIIPVAPFDFIIFGGTGDLSERKLLPALYHRQRDHQFSEPTRIIGASRSKMSDEDFRAFARKSITEHVKAEYIDKAELEKFLSRLSYVPVDAKSGDGFDKLKKALGESDTIRVFYLAVAPGIFGDISHKVKEHKLITANSRIVVEKPIGRDLESAKVLNDIIAEDFGEDQIFRIDHYLGKETVQNLMALRFANALYEPLWNYAHVDHVQITVAETVGLEDRVTYYDTAGALRDMVQNHMLQLVCLVAMEAPASMDANAVRDEKLKVLNSLKRINGLEAPKSTVRGQYRAGASSGGPVKGYLEELGSNNGSNTETFVAIKAEIANWRWAGVPFYLRTGKRLAARVSEIVIEFKPIPHSIFNDMAGPIQPNQLVIRLQPDEGVKQFIMIKDPGPGGMRLRQIPLDMSFATSFNERAPDAYERLIMDVVRGNQTLFMRRDEVEAAWRWVDPILRAWEDGRQEAQGYTSGTWGPSASIALIERDGRTWHESV